MHDYDKIYHSYETFTVEQLRELIGNAVGKKRIPRDGYMLNIGSQRMLTFIRHGTDCVACGRIGQYFSADCQTKSRVYKQWAQYPKKHKHPPAHINLYGVDGDGTRFMMTSDHVIPKSLGGSDSVDNRIPLCDDCNRKKGNDPDWLNDLPKDNCGHLIRRRHKQVVGVKNKNG